MTRPKNTAHHDLDICSCAKNTASKTGSPPPEADPLNAALHARLAKATLIIMNMQDYLRGDWTPNDGDRQKYLMQPILDFLDSHYVTGGRDEG